MSLIKEKEITFESFRKKITITVEHLPSEQRIQFLASELIREIRGKDEIDVECVYIPIFVHKHKDDVDVCLSCDDNNMRVPYLYDGNKKED